MGNDWSGLDTPPLGGWRPELTVSVVIPAYGSQQHLDLTLAALSRQTYPAELLEVIVVDDGSPNPLRLPQLRPSRTRIVRAEGPGWGPGHAVARGVRDAAGEIIHRLDADMVLFPDHVEALARWHHLVPYAVSLGMKRFADVAASTVTAAQVADDAAGLFTTDGTEPHDYIEDMFRRTRDLRDAGSAAFLAHVGATVAVRRELYERAGGYDPDLHLGEDTEFGYRLAQAGALFIPDRQARAWHVGPTAMTKRGERLRRFNRPFLATRMPEPRWLRKNGGTSWAVPLVTATVDVDGQPLELVRACVDGLLTGDIQVVLSGPWNRLADERRDVLDDPDLDLRLIRETYRADQRVRFVVEPPRTAFPAPFLLRVPAYARLAADTVPMLIAEAERHEAAVVLAGAVELRRTAADSRAAWSGASLEHRKVSPAAAGITDLRQLADAALAELLVDAQLSAPERWTPMVVEVGGVRTLLRAAAMVAKLTAIRAARQFGRRNQDRSSAGRVHHPSGR
ncbi:GT2 family glycosyltransferase [Hamadaea flava]|uniref:Glycosyltransferase n=1 Tax=Hamadaea flava TaxID=1742688 RepID=A0ABV8LYC0_9ACTN|nr:glycosyltransferase [Hamadaea flava]MCP2327373.1 GT2 family glycosyltransferase [Hamadaea flava]